LSLESKEIKNLVSIKFGIEYLKNKYIKRGYKEIKGCNSKKDKKLKK